MVKIVECPRDAWQGLTHLIPAEQKADYLRNLIDAGFTHIDAASFVSPSAVPQMADAEAVLALLHIPSSVEMIGIVVNERGAHRAIRTGKITTLGYPYSVSPSFLKNNQHQAPHEALTQLSAIQSITANAGLGLVVYLSMAFGNPYGDFWSIAQVTDACQHLTDLGIQQISLADTVGLASPSLVADLVGAAIQLNPHVEIGVHLHTRSQEAESLVEAAYQANCRRFDAAIGGLGGCPFAQAELVGNMPTELLLNALQRLKADVPAIGPLDGLIHKTSAFAHNFSK